MKVKIADLVFDKALSARRGLNAAAIERYKGIDHWPAIDVFKIDDKLLVADGVHRSKAAGERGDTTIEATIHKGTMAEAEVFALTANTKHGLPLTIEERDAAIVRLAEMGWPQRKIAKELGVAQSTVSCALQTAQLIDLVHDEGIQRLKAASMREIAKAEQNHWKPLAKAAAEHGWAAKETALAVANLEDEHITEAQREEVLKTGAPIAYDEDGEPALLGDTVRRVMGQSDEMDAAMQFGKLQAQIVMVKNNWTWEQIVDGVVKFGQHDYDLLLKELPEQIAFLQSVLDEARSRRNKLKLVSG